MINVKIYRQNGLYYKYEVSGHANYDIHGRDIVCAAVSALTQTILITLDETSRITYKVIEDIGFIEVLVSDKDMELIEIQVLFKALEIGIKTMEHEYPEYVKLEIVNKTP